MMGLDSATSSFLALLVNNIEKSQKGKIKNKTFQLRIKKVQNHYLSRKFCQVTHLQDLRIFVGQEWSLNSKGQKMKSFGNKCKF